MKLPASLASWTNGLTISQARLLHKELLYAYQRGLADGADIADQAGQANLSAAATASGISKFELSTEAAICFKVAVKILEKKATTTELPD